MSSLKETARLHLNNFLKDSAELKSKQDILLTQIDYLVNFNGKKDKVVYTCITGGYENLLLQNYLNPEWDYVCFTDSSGLLKYKNYGGWKIRRLEFSGLDNARNNRWHKTHPHILFPDYNESIYIDGNIVFTDRQVFDEIESKKLPLVIPEHWRDDSIYAEIENVRENKFETEENLEKIQSFLRASGFPDHYGLNENNCIYRQHNNPKVIEMMDEWWKFICDYTKRDQLSLAYVLWRHKIKPSDISITNLRKRANSTLGGECYLRRITNSLLVG